MEILERNIKKYEKQADSFCRNCRMAQTMRRFYNSAFFMLKLIMPKYLKILISIIGVTIAGVLVYFSLPKQETPNEKINESVFCTMEAKQCPDGSYVGRTGLKCEFTPCPDFKEKSTSTLESPGFLKGNITIGPICPVERIDNPCKPTPEMYAARKIFVYNQTKTLLVKEIIPGPDGGYKVDLAPGAYVIDVEHFGIGSARGAPAQIKIESGKTINLDIDIDTGIR